MAQHDNLYDEVSKVAFELHVKRGRVHGCDIEDWLAAEQIVMERYAKEMGQETNIIVSSEGKKASGSAKKPKTFRTSKKTSESSSPQEMKKKLPKKKAE